MASTDTVAPEVSEYRFTEHGLSPVHDYLLPALLRNLARECASGRERRIFELGCGNGSIAHALTMAGYDVTGVDASESGIRQAHQAYPSLKLASGSAYDDLANQYGRFP